MNPNDPKKHIKSPGNAVALQQHFAQFYGVRQGDNGKELCPACKGTKDCAVCGGDGCDV